MADESNIETIVFRAIDRVNELLPNGSPLEKSTNEVLLAPGSKLDSMGIVNLVCALEDEVSREFGVELNLMDLKASNGEHPLETVGSCVRYLTNMLNFA